MLCLESATGDIELWLRYESGGVAAINMLNNTNYSTYIFIMQIMEFKKCRKKEHNDLKF